GFAFSDHGFGTQFIDTEPHQCGWRQHVPGNCDAQCCGATFGCGGYSHEQQLGSGHCASQCEHRCGSQQCHLHGDDEFGDHFDFFYHLRQLCGGDADGFAFSDHGFGTQFIDTEPHQCGWRQHVPGNCDAQCCGATFGCGGYSHEQQLGSGHCASQCEHRCGSQQCHLHGDDEFGDHFDFFYHLRQLCGGDADGFAFSDHGFGTQFIDTEPHQCGWRQHVPGNCDAQCCGATFGCGGYSHEQQLGSGHCASQCEHRCGSQQCHLHGDDEFGDHFDFFYHLRKLCGGDADGFAFSDHGFGTQFIDTEPHQCGWRQHVPGNCDAQCCGAT